MQSWMWLSSSGLPGGCWNVVIHISIFLHQINFSSDITPRVLSPGPGWIFSSAVRGACVHWFARVILWQMVVFSLSVPCHHFKASMMLWSLWWRDHKLSASIRFKMKKDSGLDSFNMYSVHPNTITLEALSVSRCPVLGGKFRYLGVS